jgi:hypothetical protein
LREVDGALAKVADPGGTLIVAFDSHFLGFRHAGYSLPQFLTVECPEVALPDGTRVFAMRGRDTSLLPSLPAVASERFVFYPLPQGDPSYQKDLESVESKLPPGGISVVHADGVEFVTGPVSCLGWLCRKQLPRYPASSVYPVFQLKPALYTTVHTWVEGRGHKGLNSDICLRRRVWTTNCSLPAVETPYALRRLVA